MFEEEFASFQRASKERKARQEQKAQLERAAFFKFLEGFESACNQVVIPMFQSIVGTAREHGFDAAVRDGSGEKTSRAVALELSKRHASPQYLTCSFSIESRPTHRDVTLKVSLRPGQIEERQVDLAELAEKPLSERLRLFVRQALPSLDN